MNDITGAGARDHEGTSTPPGKCSSARSNLPGASACQEGDDPESSPPSNTATEGNQPAPLIIPTGGGRFVEVANILIPEDQARSILRAGDVVDLPEGYRAEALDGLFDRWFGLIATTHDLLLSLAFGLGLDFASWDSPADLLAKIQAELPFCRHCGCTYEVSCEGGCSWSDVPGLCTRCHIAAVGNGPILVVPR